MAEKIRKVKGGYKFVSNFTGRVRKGGKLYKTKQEALDMQNFLKNMVKRY
ncbi:MAG: hypothetical protein GY920_21295 [Aliivibrio sp.]|nr:hypothetical protein [Aliivibrio sp.]